MKKYTDIDTVKILIDEILDNRDTLINYSCFNEGADSFKNVEFSCNAREDYQGVFLNCKLAFDYDCECYRCLEKITKHFERDFVVKPVDEDLLEKEEDRIYNSSEEIFVYPTVNSYIDLRNIIYEQMNFALPLTIECDNECSANWTQYCEDGNEHRSETSESDSSPFAILKNLKFDE